MLQTAWEDLEPGLVVSLGSKHVTAGEIIEFAEEFDPQPMHLSAEAGKASILGGLSASGWHSCAMLMRLMYDGYFSNSTSQGSPGIDQMRWKKPVLAGDTLTGSIAVLGRRISRSRPDLGLVTARATLVNQRGEIVLEMENTAMFLLRNPEAAR